MYILAYSPGTQTEAGHYVDNQKTRDLQQGCKGKQQIICQDAAVEQMCSRNVNKDCEILDPVLS